MNDDAFCDLWSGNKTAINVMMSPLGRKETLQKVAREGASCGADDVRVTAQGEIITHLGKHESSNNGDAIVGISNLRIESERIGSSIRASFPAL